MSVPTVVRSLAAAALLAVTGCGSDTSTGTDPGPSDDGATLLPAGSYVAGPGDVEGRTLVRGTELRLTVEEGRLGLDAGCNGMGGRARVVDGVLRTGGLVQTEMGCAPALMAQDEWVASMVSGGPEVTLVDGGIRLAGDLGIVRFRSEEGDVVGRALEGTTWVLESVVQGAVVSSVVGEPPTLELTGDTVRVFDGCNQGRGEAVLGDGTLRVEALAVTRRACAEDVMAQAEVVLGVVEDAAYAIEGDTLTLSGPDAELVLRAR